MKRVCQRECEQINYRIYSSTLLEKRFEVLVLLSFYIFVHQCHYSKEGTTFKLLH